MVVYSALMDFTDLHTLAQKLMANGVIQVTIDPPATPAPAAVTPMMLLATASPAVATTIPVHPVLPCVRSTSLRATAHPVVMEGKLPLTPTGDILAYTRQSLPSTAGPHSLSVPKTLDHARECKLQVSALLRDVIDLVSLQRFLLIQVPSLVAVLDNPHGLIKRSAHQFSLFWQEYTDHIAVLQADVHCSVEMLADYAALCNTPSTSSTIGMWRLMKRAVRAFEKLGAVVNELKSACAPVQGLVSVISNDRSARDPSLSRHAAKNLLAQMRVLDAVVVKLHNMTFPPPPVASTVHLAASVDAKLTSQMLTVFDMPVPKLSKTHAVASAAAASSGVRPQLVLHSSAAPRALAVNLQQPLNAPAASGDSLPSLIVEIRSSNFLALCDQYQAATFGPARQSLLAIIIAQLNQINSHGQEALNQSQQDDQRSFQMIQMAQGKIQQAQQGISQSQRDMDRIRQQAQDLRDSYNSRSVWDQIKDAFTFGQDERNLADNMNQVRDHAQQLAKQMNQMNDQLAQLQREAQSVAIQSNLCHSIVGRITSLLSDLAAVHADVSDVELQLAKMDWNDLMGLIQSFNQGNMINKL
jgi:hypothetical protein